MKTLLNLLFGKWEVIGAVNAMVEMRYTRKDEEHVVVLERHSKAKEERAYILRLNGYRYYIPVEYVRAKGYFKNM